MVMQMVNRLRRLWQKVMGFLLEGRSLQQLVRYLVTGVGSFLFEYALFYVFLRWLGLYELVANSVAIFLAFCLNFTINRIWSFESKEPLLKQLLLYISLFAFNMLFSNGFIFAASSWLSISPLISKVLAMCLIVCWNFIIYKKVIFRSA